MLTESYRYAPASLVAPLDYTTMIWAFMLGYALFGEVPTVYVFVGGAIVAASGTVRDLARAPARAPRASAKPKARPTVGVIELRTP